MESVYLWREESLHTSQAPVLVTAPLQPYTEVAFGVQKEARHGIHP